MTTTLADLQVRWSALSDLATRLTTDERRLSTPLDPDDDLVERALSCHVPLVTPLTIGTLLAAVLGEADGVECAIETIRRNERPGEDLPDPLAGWQRRSDIPHDRVDLQRSP